MAKCKNKKFECYRAKMAYLSFEDLEVRDAPREGDRTNCCTEATADAIPSRRVFDKLGARGVRLAGRRGGILTG